MSQYLTYNIFWGLQNHLHVLISLLISLQCWWTMKMSVTLDGFKSLSNYMLCHLI
jgi:hypothetical protein